jgi:hypothetical protein
MPGNGREGRLANGRFREIRFAETGIGRTAAMEHADRPDWVGSDRRILESGRSLNPAAEWAVSAAMLSDTAGGRMTPEADDPHFARTTDGQSSKRNCDEQSVGVIGDFARFDCLARLRSRRLPNRMRDRV